MQKILKLLCASVFSCAIFIGLVSGWILITNWKVTDQQRQTDQLCQVAFTLARAQGATDLNGFEGGKEYCFFFADYSRGMALLGEFDGEIRYDKKPRLIIMHNVREDVLQSWDKAELCYDYKKIRN